MKFPIANWSVQSAISFGGDLSGAVATAVGTDESVYFAMSAKGAYPPPTPGMLGVPLVTQGLYTVPPGAFPVMNEDYADFLTNPVRNPSFNIVIGKISAQGTPQWILVSPVLVTTTDESQPALAIGPSNELYVVYGTQGATYGNINQQEVPLFCNACRGAGPYDIVLARIDEVGGQPSVTWVKQNGELNSCNNETVPQIAIDSANQALYVAWECNYNIACFPAIGTKNVLLSCFRLGDGRQLWIDARTNLNSTGANTNPVVAADTTGGVYIAFETTAQVQGGAVPPSKQIELIRYQTTFTAPGVVSAYRRDWIYSGFHSGPESLFSETGPSQAPSLSFSNTGILCVGFTTVAAEVGGPLNDLVMVGIDPTGTFRWKHRGHYFNRNAIGYVDCGNPRLSSDIYGNLYCALLVTTNVILSPLTTAKSLFLYKLNPFDGVLLWEYISPRLERYSTYPYALTLTASVSLGTNSVFPSGDFTSSSSVTVRSGNVYVATSVPPPLAPGTDTHTGADHDLCITQLGVANYAEGQSAYEYMIDFQPTQINETPPSLMRRRPR